LRRSWYVFCYPCSKPLEPHACLTFQVDLGGTYRAPGCSSCLFSFCVQSYHPEQQFQTSYDYPLRFFALLATWNARVIEPQEHKSPIQQITQSPFPPPVALYHPYPVTMDISGTALYQVLRLYPNAQSCQVERQTSHVNNKASSSAFYLICFLIALASSLCIYFKIFQSSCSTSKTTSKEHIIPTSNNWQLYARSFIAMYPSSLLQWVWRLGYWLLYLSGIAPR